MISENGLLQELAKQRGWVLGADLAKTFNVTTRTLRSYVRRINEAYRDGPIESSHYGYRLVSPSGPSPTVERTATQAIPEGSDARVSHLFAQLLTKEQGISVYDLADELCVADSTIMSDLQRAREIARAFGLKLAHSRGIVSLDGTEREKRRLISHFIAEQGWERGYFSLASQLIGREGNDGHYFATLTTESMEREGLYVSDYGLSNIELHLAIMLDRVSQDRTVDETVDTARLEGTSSWRVARRIADAVFEQDGTVIPASELYYFALLISTNSRESFDKTSSVKSIEACLDEADLVASRQALRALELAYDLDHFDDNFVIHMAIHVHSLVLRARENSFIPNPLAGKTKDSYPLVYDMSVFLAKQLSYSLDIDLNEDEIAFLAFHIGGYFENNVIDRDVVTLSVLHIGYNDFHVAQVKRLQQTFGDKVIVGRVDSVMRTDPAQLRSDIVVAPVQLEVPLSGEIIVVSPIMSEDDIQAIGRAVERARSRKHAFRTISALRQFLRPELFRRNLYARTKYELIELLCHDCEEKGLCGPDFCEDVLEREKLSSTAFGEICAAPHSIGSTAHNSFLYLVVNDHSVRWGDQRVNIILLIGTSENDRNSFRVAYEELLILLSEGYANSLSKCTTYASFINQLEDAIMTKHKLNH
nr:PRD domain-containing protein [Olegusella massiliensis]